MCGATAAPTLQLRRLQYLRPPPHQEGSGQTAAHRAEYEGSHQEEEDSGEAPSSEGPLSALQQLSAGRQDGILTGDEAEEGQHARPVQPVHARVHQQALGDSSRGTCCLDWSLELHLSSPSFEAWITINSSANL